MVGPRWHHASSALDEGFRRHALRALDEGFQNFVSMEHRDKKNNDADDNMCNDVNAPVLLAFAVASPSSRYV
jgi:hypothetical protein